MKLLRSCIPIQRLKSLNTTKVKTSIQTVHYSLEDYSLTFLGLKPTGKKTGTGAHSTDAEVLKELAEQHEVPQLVLDIDRK